MKTYKTTTTTNRESILSKITVLEEQEGFGLPRVQITTTFPVLPDAPFCHINIYWGAGRTEEVVSNLSHDDAVSYVLDGSASAYYAEQKADTRYINTTPHDIHLHINGEIITFPRSERPARAEEIKFEVTPYRVAGEEIPVFRKKFGEVRDLPRPVPGVIFITSQVVKDAAKGRRDLVTPDSLVRDDEGRIIGCEGFAV